MRYGHSILVSVLCAVPMVACNSDTTTGAADGGNHVDGGQSAAALFSTGACKKETSAVSTLARLRTLKVIDDESSLDGLRCVAWRRVPSGGISIDLYNFDGACGAVWTGDAAVAADGTLNLHIDNPSCAIAKCGTCLYDWSFSLNEAVAVDAAVPVSIAADVCVGSQSTATWSAQIGPEDKGIHCTLAAYGALTWQAVYTHTCGKVGMPCVGSSLCGSGGFTSTGTCDPGLVCDSSAAVNEPVCLLPCVGDADCPRADVWSCQAGLCRPIP